MSGLENNTWSFSEIPGGENLDIEKIFGSSGESAPAPTFTAPPVQQGPQEPIQLTPQAPVQPMPAAEQPQTMGAQPAASQETMATQPAQSAAVPPASAVNPIAAAFEQRTAENTRQGLLERLPVFYHKGVKEDIEDTSMTFEELRIRKSEDFADLEEGKKVSWSVEYCGIRKEIKDPKGTAIASMKETIERSREFLDALKKSKDKEPRCYVKPKVEMKTKGNAAYKGRCGSLEEARASDKVICLVPSGDGRMYEMRKLEQGEFIAPKNKVAEFPLVRAGFTPALPKIPAKLMGEIIGFFRSFMSEGRDSEALALIYWDKVEKEFLAYIPKQTVCRVEIEADLRDCPYDDTERYICYADIHSHNRMDAFFSAKDDSDECSTGLYFVLGNLDRFYPDIKARIFCGDSFVPIDPETVIEGLEQPFPEAWHAQVTVREERDEKKDRSENWERKHRFLDRLSEVRL